MAFGYEYLVVYLPEFIPDSFLLFVHNPAGSTKLRDYSSGRERVLGQPALSYVSKATEFGKTRFREDPYTVSGADGVSHWRARIADYNSRYLLMRPAIADRTIAKPSSISRSSVGGHGRALRGSQRQIQEYVNSRQDDLNRAVLGILPTQLAEIVREIRWVSPLVGDDYAEFRDEDFLKRVGLGDFKGELAAFWPANGPSWDALATVTTCIPNSVPIVILLEAKSHIPEVYGNGCQASAKSRAQIEEALLKAKRWCGASPEADWTGRLYQSANRIAHLYFVREQLKRPAWLINIYFTDDPICPTSLEEWQSEVSNVKAALGLESAVPELLELFLPALNEDRSVAKEDIATPHAEDAERSIGPEQAESGAEKVAGDSTIEFASRQPRPKTEPTDFEAFSIWRERWTALAEYPGSVVPDLELRIHQLLNLWSDPIPGRWRRNIDPQLLLGRYRRGDIENPHLGEHAIEHEVLVNRFEQVSCLGMKLVDGVTAFPLCTDVRRLGRNGNVEADMLLLGVKETILRLFLCEVKDQSNNAWYATVESLRQLKLFLENREVWQTFVNRGTIDRLPADTPASALVVAPAMFYLAPGKKQNSLRAAKELIARFGLKYGVDIRLTIWDRDRCEIRDLP